MRKIENIKLESIVGGGAAEFADGFCQGWGAIRVLRLASSAIPVVNVVGLGIDVACVGWSLYRA